MTIVSTAANRARAGETTMPVTQAEWDMLALDCWLNRTSITRDSHVRHIDGVFSCCGLPLVVTA